MNPQLSGQQDHWRAAMEHNKAVLASQENEMKEYLKRQQVSAVTTRGFSYFVVSGLLKNFLFHSSELLRSTSSSSVLLCLARMESPPWIIMEEVGFDLR